MPHTTFFERALASVTAAVLSAGVLCAALGAGGSAPVEVSAAARTVLPVADSPPADAPPTSTGGTAVALAAEATSPTTTTPPPTTPTTAPPTTAPPPPPTTAPPAPAPAPPPPPPPAPAAPTTTAVPAPHPARAPSTSFARRTACESNMLRWMNEARSAHRLGPLQADGGIQWIPVGWSDTMATRQDLAHNPRFGEQIFAERPQAMSASENVGRTTGRDRSVFDGFMQSPPHRAEILSSTSTHASVGCLRDGGGQLWVTVNFWG